MVSNTVDDGESKPVEFAYVPTTKPVREEDRDAEVLRIDLEAVVTDQTSVDNNSSLANEEEEDLVEDGAGNLLVVKAETCAAVFEMLNGEEPQMSSAILVEKVIPFVEYGSHQIYKSTLVSQLNANPFLSKDRLKRSETFNLFQ